MNAYHKRDATRRERIIEAATRRGDDRRAAAKEHAHAVLNKYEDAYRVCFPGKTLPAMTYEQTTGYYRVDGKAMRENVLTTATNWMYAKVHEQEIGPDE